MTEQEKINELMKPRYRCIADWPFNNHFKTDEVVLLDQLDNRAHLEPERYMIKQPHRYAGEVMPLTMYDSEFKKYPHLFRELEWWQEREASEMPEYVKPKNPEEYRKQFGEVVLKVDKRTSGLHSFHAVNLFQLASMQWSKWLPATEDDYQAFITKPVNQD